MKSLFRLLFVVSAILSLASCDKPMPPATAAPVAAETDNQLAEARDALQRQALEIETKTALMDKQLAEMAQSLKDRENAELRDSLDALKRQNDELRVQADAARRQSDAITQRIAVAPQQNVASQPVALPDYSLFYDRLAPFGRWFDVNGYGYCWRPTITVAGWRPYVDGCWVWSSLGWAWQTNEPFGWATYHYGRWVNLAHYGWIWVPGSEWAPAWVAWRQSRDCVGWAPLPPEPGAFSGVYRDCDSRYGLGPTSYTFINTNQFVSPTYINVYAPVTRQTVIFQHSVNVTQIVRSRSHGHAFVQQGGPPRAQMEQACRQPVPQRQVQTMHADEMPEQQQHHGRRDADAPMAMGELPTMAPGAHMRRPDVKEHIQRPVRTSGFDGVPQHVATEIRENIAKEKETAAVQQPVHGHMPHRPGRHPGEAPAVVQGAPRVPNAPPQEAVSSAIAMEKPVEAQVVAPVETPAVQQQPGQGSRPHQFPRHSVEAPPSTSMPAVPNAPAQETVRPAAAAESATGATREPRTHGQPAMGAPHQRSMPPESKVVENSAPATAPAVPSVMPAMVENKAAESSATAVVPVNEPERTVPAVVTAPPAVMPQPPAEPSLSQQPVAAEKMAAEQGADTASAEAERAQRHAAREQARAAAMDQRQQQGMQERAMAENRAAEQAAANAEAEKNRIQAAAAAAQQQEALIAQQQRMAADQAAAETEKARQQAEAAAVQQQQEMAAQQQRANAERMAAEQAAVAETERVRQQTEAAAMQRQQEEATRRAAEEQQMRAQQETERRAQEMAQRQAEEAARRQQEAEMQRAQDQARRAAEEQARAQQEAAQRAQEMAQRQAEEQARRAQEEAQRAAAEAARNQPQPAPGS
ncbi:MAG: hypothetical protein B7Z37_02030 [Verrucomicrobia bacterium 12-59-8]|nr:MAG: hypothetical protein B7Z37_02030 [Verrucomicrobia bacterium 12-59-8]